MLNEEDIAQRPLPDILVRGTRDWALAERVLSYDKISWAISKASTYKSSAKHGILPVLMQEGLEVIIGHVMNIFKACIGLAYVPLSCSVVSVVFIPKLGCKNNVQANSFRPVNPTSFIFKHWKGWWIGKEMEPWLNNYCTPINMISRLAGPWRRFSAVLLFRLRVDSGIGLWLW